jgi:DNA-directed RNA polymerase subunit RPC12/RpoP
MAVLCSNCSGKLVFNPAYQKLECSACGSRFDPEDVKDINADAQSKYYDTRVYTCAHCGAEIITSDTEVSTFCVYCGNPAINFSRIKKEYKPDGLIPFQITKEEAAAKIKEKFLANPFIPKEVKSKAVPENIRGIYVPYWIVNARFTEASYIQAEVNNGEKIVTKYYQRVGTCNFQNIPIDGSNILLDEVSSRLEPFYFAEAKEFDEDYLNGFYSNTSDMTYKNLQNAVAARCHELYSKEACSTVENGKSFVNDAAYWAYIQDDPLYMMMPVWFFTFIYKNEPHTILINGQSGKVVGTMPWSKKKIGMLFASVCLAILALMVLAAVGIAFDFGGLKDLYNIFIVVVALIAAGTVVPGLLGLRKIRNNITLTKADAIFKFVKKRQG